MIIKTIQKYPKNSIFLTIIVLTGMVVRLFTYPQVFESGRIVFLETDPYYHMWRVFSFINIFPGTFLFDPFINYPYGSLVGWPPLFDQVISLVSIIVGRGHPNIHLVESVGAFMPLVLGLFSIISGYFIAREIFNEKIALYSSLLLAVLPAHAQISFLGFTDHHIAEVLISVLAYLFFIKSMKNGSLRDAIFSGIAIGISFLTWIGAPIFIGILLSYAAVQFILDTINRQDTNYLMRTGTISFLTAFLILLLFYIWTPWQRSITTGTLSYFQLIYVAASAAIIIFLGSASRIMKDKKWYFYPLTIIILVLCVSWILINAFPSFYESLLSGIGYLMKDAPVLKQISEAQPLFYSFDGIFLGWQFFDNPVWYSFAFSFYIAIIGFVWLMYSWRKRINKAELFFIIWTAIILVLALYQRRFTYALSINVAILSGYFLDKCMKKIRSFSLSSYSIILIFIAVILILIVPNVVTAYDMAQEPPMPSPDWYDSLVWLRDNTPDQQYGIMAWWDYGNWILYISKRPVVSNNFQIGGDDAAKFFLSSEEVQANRIMEMRKARYVIADRKMGLNKYMEGNQLVLKGTFMAVVSFAEQNIAFYLDKNNLPNENYFQTMYARLQVFDGIGLMNYRMVYESNETHFDLFDKQTRNIKIYEYVRGAKITGNTLPGEIVSVSGRVITNQKRTFEYSQTIKADDKGYFEFTVPYSKNGPYETRLLERYELKSGNTTRSLNITENDIMIGNKIMVK